MFCCGKGKLLGEFFEKGFGKFLLILSFLFITFYLAYFTISSFLPKTFPPNQFIELKRDLDLFLSKNDAGYGGYIRFDTETPRHSRSQPKEASDAKIVLQFQKDSQRRHAVKIELFDKTHRPISEVLLERKSFAPVESGYSYNICDLKFPEPYTIYDVAYFRYSLIEG